MSGCPWTENDIEALEEAASGFLMDEGRRFDRSVPDGRPYRLSFLRELADIRGDEDVEVFDLAAVGFPTGVFEPIQASSVWRPTDGQSEPQEPDLLMLQGNRTAADKHTVSAASLVEKDLRAGFVRQLPGGMVEANRCWLGRTSQGKLNLVVAESTDDRLVLDSSVTGVKQAGKIDEKVFNP